MYDTGHLRISSGLVYNLLTWQHQCQLECPNLNNNNRLKGDQWHWKHGTGGTPFKLQQHYLNIQKTH